MRPLPTPERQKIPVENAAPEQDGKETDDAAAQLTPQQIPTFEELAEVLPNLKRDLR